MPLRLVWLESVVAANATLLVGDRRVDCTKYQVVVDIKEFRHRFWIWSGCKRLDSCGHFCIGRRRHDLASRTTDRGQTKFGILAILPVERLDRVRAERGG